MSFIYIKHNSAESGDSPLGDSQQNCENINRFSYAQFSALINNHFDYP